MSNALWILLGVALSGPALAAKPNIVYIMADDLNFDWKSDRLSYMPNLKKYFKDEGTQFTNHVAAIPVCGPSRSSMLLGRYPHNTGYLMNDDLDSVDAYLAEHDDTVGKWLKDAGYHSAFLGKYVNGVANHVPAGWSYWGGFIQTYNFYNASAWDVDFDGPTPVEKKIQLMTDVHQADFLGNFTLDQARKAIAKGKPFFISVTPVMPHWGVCYGPTTVYAPDDPYFEFTLVNPLTGNLQPMPTSPCVTHRHAHAFDGKDNPRIPGVWNTSTTGSIPKFMQGFSGNGHLDSWQTAREDIGFRNRSASLLDLDYMIGVIMEGLDDLGVLEDTFVVFTSDNGYHLGEHKMPCGKGEPYETDVQLPMYVRGPGVARNHTLHIPTTHLDTTATIVDWATAQAPLPLDGMSFASQLNASATLTWRDFSFSEFFSNTNTWRQVRIVNQTHKLTYAWWCTNDTEVFDLLADPMQMHNLDGSHQGEIVRSNVGTWAQPLGECSGQACHNPIPASSSPVNGSLECYNDIPSNSARQGEFSFVKSKSDSATVVGVSGWAVDFNFNGGHSGKLRGFDPVTVRVAVDGKWNVGLPAVSAQLSRPDIMNGGGFHALIPNPEHGFGIDGADWPDALLEGNHRIELRELNPNNPNNPGAAWPLNARCLCGGKECTC